MDQKCLIISTGDVSDVDGFYALAEYAKSGADCLFIMNYPAYVSEGVVQANANKNNKENPGLGYHYPATAIPGYNGQEFTGAKNAKDTLTNVAFSLAKYVWYESIGRQGNNNTSRDWPQLYFCIGGVNTINPFNFDKIKNEPGVYAPALESEDRNTIRLSSRPYEEGSVFDTLTKYVNFDDSFFEKYSDIYMDFNGSMAFLDTEWMNKLNKISGKLKGVFVMGGVYSDEPPQTMSAIPKVLNRFGCATMNQLYAPEQSAEFFKWVQGTEIPVYIVPNNEVPDLKDTLEAFLDANGLTGPFLRQIADLYYKSPYGPPPKKAFDFYTAKALVTARMGGPLASVPKVLFFDDVYGATFVAPVGSTAEQVITGYAEKLEAKYEDMEAKKLPPFLVNGVKKEKEMLDGGNIKLYSEPTEVRVLKIDKSKIDVNFRNVKPSANSSA
jgi:hypothetical protein